MSSSCFIWILLRWTFFEDNLLEFFDDIPSKYGIICLTRSQSFSKNQHFILPDTHTHVCVSGGKKCWFFQKLCERTEWMIPITRHSLGNLKKRSILHVWQGSECTSEVSCWFFFPVKTFKMLCNRVLTWGYLQIKRVREVIHQLLIFLCTGFLISK